MEEALWFIWLMALGLMSLLAQEQWAIYTRLANFAYDTVLAWWCMMMRHTGDPIYTYQARRYR